MPSGSRIRSNSVFGTVADNPLSSIATTFNSNQLLLLPTVTTQHAVITLDPLRQFGDPEIIIVTTHTAAATVATITRAAYGTSAREHPFGTVWVHALIDEDTIEILTSGTRPGDPYEGQAIYETDTNRWAGYDGSVWQPSLHNPPRCRATQANNQTITNNVLTNITFDGADQYDTDSMHNPLSNSDRIVIPVAGVYAISGYLGLAGDSDYTEVLVRIMINNTVEINQNRNHVQGNATIRMNVADAGYQLALGDFVSLNVRQINTSGTNNATVAPACNLAVVWVAPA